MVMSNGKKPSVQIIEQPSSKSTRFRYECEARCGGSIQGVSSRSEKKTYPTIRVNNYNGSLVVVVSLVTKDEPAKPHPHALVGTDCKQDVCTKKIKGGCDSIQFPNLGVQCRKKKELDDALKLRKKIRVDPFRTGFDHADKQKANDIDLSVVRLCFQVFLPDASGKYQTALDPICSEPIYDKKSAGELYISSYLPVSCEFRGNEDMILLTGKLPKDVEVVFYEGSNDRDWQWHRTVTPTSKELHGPLAMKIKIPEYSGPNDSRRAANCQILLRKRDNPSECSSPVQFTYHVDGGLNYSAPRKRKAEKDMAGSMKHIKREACSDGTYMMDAASVPETVGDLTTDHQPGMLYDGLNTGVASTVTVVDGGSSYPHPYPTDWVPLDKNITIQRNSDGSFIASASNGHQQALDISNMNLPDNFMDNVIQQQETNAADILIPSTLSEYLRTAGISSMFDDNGSAPQYQNL